jgi:hypothetical protein
VKTKHSIRGKEKKHGTSGRTYKEAHESWKCINTETIRYSSGDQHVEHLPFMAHRDPKNGTWVLFKTGQKLCLFLFRLNISRELLALFDTSVIIV